MFGNIYVYTYRYVHVITICKKTTTTTTNKEVGNLKENAEGCITWFGESK